MFRYLLIFAFLLGTAANAQQWVLVWSDEFNTPGLPDTSRWSNEVGLIRNNELQYYTERRIENTHIDDTTLIIEARKEDYIGASYTSASLMSRYNGDWLYGRIEVRAKIPTGRGSWPAIWMMPSENKYGGWPYSGEIDIMENVGYEADNIYSTVHYYGTDGSGHQSSGSHVVRSAPYDTFYTYTIEWTPDKIDWYIDEAKVYTYNRPLNADYRLWPFNERFYIILNLAIGGAWGGVQGIDPAIFPLKYYIDFVRIYTWQTSDGPFTLSVEPVAGGTVDVSPQQTGYEPGEIVQLTATADAGYYFGGFLYMGNANPLEIQMNEDKSVVGLFYKTDELIKNGDFDRGITGWNNIYIFDHATEAAKAAWEDSAYVFQITDPATAWWHMGDQWLGIPAVNGKTYRVTFDAWAEHPAEIGLSFSRNHHTYEYYYENPSIYISSTRTHYTWDFTFNAPSDNNCRLYFGMGRFSGKVYLDQISMTELNPTPVGRVITTAGPEILVNADPATRRLGIVVDMVSPGNARFCVYNLNGIRLLSLFKGYIPSGYHRLTPEKSLSHLPSGIYLLQYRDDQTESYTKFTLP